MRQALGLYIHIPFCKRKCHYCDFYSVAADPDRIRRYADALITDIKQKSGLFSGVCFDSLFIGGGTPSVMGNELIRMIEAAQQSFVFMPQAEMTCEANPESLTFDLLVKLKQVGINRISIGAQSFCDEELNDLGRLHDRNGVIRAYQDIRKAGFENINVDIMFGIGHKTCKIDHFQAFSKTLHEVIALDIPHISCYNLTIQKETALYRDRDQYRFADEDEEEKMYQLLCQILAAHGYEHYEISNFAKSGYACKHNMKYWRSHPYLGIGPAAHSYVDGIRYSHASDLAQYLSGQMTDITEEIMTPRDIARERLILGLRTSEGVNWSELDSFFDRVQLQYLVDHLVLHGLACRKEKGFALTERGFRISNAIINRLLDCERGGR